MIEIVMNSSWTLKNNIASLRNSANLTSAGFCSEVLTSKLTLSMEQ